MQLAIQISTTYFAKTSISTHLLISPTRQEISLNFLLPNNLLNAAVFEDVQAELVMPCHTRNSIGVTDNTEKEQYILKFLYSCDYFREKTGFVEVCEHYSCPRMMHKLSGRLFVIRCVKMFLVISDKHLTVGLPF